jgi:hypothetical protein
MQNGTLTGVSPGSAQYMGTNTTETPVYQPQFCSTTMCPEAEIGDCGGQATVTPPPVIEDVTPNVVMAGSSNVPVTITGSGFGTSATVNLPAGAAVVSGSQKTADGTITFRVNVSANATFGAGSITVTANGATSDGAGFTLDGPIYMTVVSDGWDYCKGCSTTVRRNVTYQIMNASGASSNAIPICEAVTQTPSTCTPAVPFGTTT